MQLGTSGLAAILSSSSAWGIPINVDRSGWLSPGESVTVDIAHTDPAFDFWGGIHGVGLTLETSTGGSLGIQVDYEGRGATWDAVLEGMDLFIASSHAFETTQSYTNTSLGPQALATRWFTRWPDPDWQSTGPWVIDPGGTSTDYVYPVTTPADETGWFALWHFLNDPLPEPPEGDTDSIVDFWDVSSHTEQQVSLAAAESTQIYTSVEYWYDWLSGSVVVTNEGLDPVEYSLTVAVSPSPGTSALVVMSALFVCNRTRRREPHSRRAQALM
jgi:hypothetical protein